MDNLDLASLREDYLSGLNNYKKLQTAALEILSNAAVETSSELQVESRIKDVDSFLKKTIKKSYADPITEINDQLGIRIITTYEDSLDVVEEFVKAEFLVHSREDKIEQMNYNEFGYLGRHFEVSLGNTRNTEISSLRFEIQLRTKAQDLWASIAHQLSYKPKSNGEPPKLIKRLIYRLIALIEIFDKEVSDAKRVILGDPSNLEGRLLATLERHYRSFSASSGDKEFSVSNP